MYLFDTNVFLEILLNQSRAGDCEKAVTSLSSDRPGWVTGFSLHAVEAIVSNAYGRLPKGREHTAQILSKFLRSVALHPHLQRYETSTEEEQTIAQLMPTVGLDFDDAVQYSVARNRRLALVTMDRDFRHLRDISVLDPGEV